MLFAQFDLFIMTAHYLKKLIKLIRTDEQQLPEFKKCALKEFLDVVWSFKKLSMPDLKRKHKIYAGALIPLR